MLAELRTRGSWKLWKAVRARTPEDVARTVERYAEVADGILVEGWREGVVGGGGVQVGVDPGEVRSLIPERLDFVLAGGLRPDTLADALAAFRPDVVDVSSGVELEVGRKDHALVAGFVSAARGASAARAGSVHQSGEVAR
jgi:phosphoribosylanthranilate isomerase